MDAATAPPAAPQSPPLGRRFLTIWAGQTLSEVGSTMSAVGVAIFVFLETGSAAWLGLLSAVATLPFLLAAPLATIVDRHPKRSVMIWADVFAAVGPAVALLLVSTGRLEVWHLVVASSVGGFGTALQIPASQAAVPALVERSALDRANALKQLGPALGVVLGPLLAAPIVATWGLETLLALDLATFVLGAGTVLAVRFEDHRDVEPVADNGSWAAAWQWLITSGRPLLKLMGLSSAANLAFALFNVGIIALATTVAGASSAGLVLGAGGVAMVVGSIRHGQRGFGADRGGIIARSLLMMSVGLAITALTPRIGVVVLGVVVALHAVPAMTAVGSTIYNERVPASMQGRVFAIRGTISQALQPVGSLLGGVGIAWLAAPAIADDGLLASTIGRVIGTGEDRAPALALLVCGIVLAILAIGLSRSDLRHELRSDEAPEACGGDSKTAAAPESCDSEAVTAGRASYTTREL